MTLIDLLANHTIQLKSLRAGHSEQVICPKCDGGRTREASLSVTVDQDGKGFVVNCHRETKCGWKDGFRLRQDEQQSRSYTRPQQHTASSNQQWFWDFWSERKIGARTISSLGIYSKESHWFQKLGNRPAIVFPYLFDGEITNRKYRPFPEKNPQAQEVNAEPTLFNVDSLGKEPDEIVFVEGEPDVAAVFECGILHTVTLKDGAPAEATFKSDDKRFESLRTHSNILGKAKKIILAGDTDKAGTALREELARRLGRHRCFMAVWPRGCKDAGDTLKEYGPDAVLATLAAAEPYPIDGVYRVQTGLLQKLRLNPAPAVMGTGTSSSDSILKIPCEGRLIVVTGFPTHGKTSWTRFIMIHTAAEHERRWAVFSPEHQPWEHFVAQCAEVYIGRPFYPVHDLPIMSEEDIGVSESFMARRIIMLVCDAEDVAPSIDWILDRARASVLREGTTDLLLDPWNEIEHVRGDMSETDYIGRTLQRLRAFALRHGCNVWIIAHPAKPPPIRPGEKLMPPGPYSISGSSNWANKTDLGITIFSPENGVVELHVWKARFRRWGSRTIAPLLPARMDFEQLTGRYRTPSGSDYSPSPVWMNR